MLVSEMLQTQKQGLQQEQQQSPQYLNIPDDLNPALGLASTLSLGLK
jgi:hypothetical protein